MFKDDIITFKGYVSVGHIMAGAVCEMSYVLGQLQNKRLGAAYNLWLCLCSQQSWWKERLVTVTSPGIFHFYSMCPPSTKNTHWQLLSAEPLHYCTVAVDNNPRPRTHIIMGTPMPNKFLFFWPGLESNIVFPTTPGHLIQFLPGDWSPGISHTDHPAGGFVHLVTEDQVWTGRFQGYCLLRENESQF